MKLIKLPPPLAAIAISLGMAASAFAATEVYVSPTGNDDTGNGTREKPYQTIIKGIVILIAVLLDAKSKDK